MQQRTYGQKCTFVFCMWAWDFQAWCYYLSKLARLLLIRHFAWLYSTMKRDFLWHYPTFEHLLHSSCFPAFFNRLAIVFQRFSSLPNHLRTCCFLFIFMFCSLFLFQGRFVPRTVRLSTTCFGIGVSFSVMTSLFRGLKSSSWTWNYFCAGCLRRSVRPHWSLQISYGRRRDVVMDFRRTWRRFSLCCRGTYRLSWFEWGGSKYGKWYRWWSRLYLVAKNMTGYIACSIFYLYNTCGLSSMRTGQTFFKKL